MAAGESSGSLKSSQVVAKVEEISYNYVETGHFFNLDALTMVARWLMKVLQICREFLQKTAMR